MPENGDSGDEHASLSFPKRKKTRLIVTIIVVISLIVSGMGAYLLWGRGKKSAPAGSATEAGGASGYIDKEYDVEIELPPGTPIELSQTKLIYGTDGMTEMGQASGNQAQAKVTMHDFSTGLLTLQDDGSGSDILLAVFPKDSEHLQDYMPTVNAESTAQAMVFMQIGVCRSDPVQARLMLEVIKELPETKELADYIAVRMGQEPAAISTDERPLYEKVAQATAAFLERVENSQATIMPTDPKGATNTMLPQLAESPGLAQLASLGAPNMPSYAATVNLMVDDVDGVDDDGITPNLSLDPDTGTGQFTWYNYMAWPAFAFIEKAGDYPDPTKSKMLDFIPPRSLEIPTMVKFTTDTLLGLGAYAFENIFKGNKDGIIDYLNNQVWSYIEAYSESTNSYTFDEPGKYNLITFYPGFKNEDAYGQAADQGDLRVFYPMMAKIGEELLEFVSICVDLGSISKALKSSSLKPGYPGFTTTNGLFVELVAKYAPSLTDIYYKVEESDDMGAFLGVANLLIEVLADPAAWEFFSRHFLGSIDIPSEVAERVLGFLRNSLGKLLTVITIIDAGIKIISLGIRIGLWIHQGKECGPLDLYEFDIELSDADTEYEQPKAQALIRCSTSLSGEGALDYSYWPSANADGRYVAFYSKASNLVPGDTNDREDVFRKDLVTGGIVRCSVSSSGEEGNGDSSGPSISSDGRYVVFNSTSSNLVPGDQNDRIDVFRKDLSSGEIVRCSVSKIGENENGDSQLPSVSSDGRYVVYWSDASNLVQGDDNGKKDVFRTDLASGDVSRCAASCSAWDEGLYSYYPSISSDGKYVVFWSDDSSLVPGDGNGTWDIFRYEFSTGQMERCSTSSQGVEANDGSFCPAMSPDGRYVAFSSGASNLVPGDTNDQSDVFRKDLSTGELVRCSTTPQGVEGDDWSHWTSISRDGRYVAFVSGATNLVAGESNGYCDIFRKDLVNGQIVRCSITPQGIETNGNTFHPFVSSNGRYVFFVSEASNLDPTDNNNARDVFRRDMTGG